MSRRVLVILSGCGFMDGAEIHESVAALLALSQEGALVTCAAPDISQSRVVDHAKGRPVRETRSVLSEAARIARGDIRGLSELRATEYDALVFPGGRGAAANLSSWATEGPLCSVENDTQRLIQEFYSAGKPICAICIAPTLLARVLGSYHPRITIGDDPSTARGIEATGAVHVVCAVTEPCVDATHKLVTVAAYMYGEAPLRDVALGIANAVRATLSLA